jgi:hypothetical protein
VKSAWDPTWCSPCIPKLGHSLIIGGGLHLACFRRGRWRGRKRTGYCVPYRNNRMPPRLNPNQMMKCRTRWQLPHP